MKCKIDNRLIYYGKWFTFPVIAFWLSLVFNFNLKLVKFAQLNDQDPKNLGPYYSSANKLCYQIPPNSLKWSQMISNGLIWSQI